MSLDVYNHVKGESISAAKLNSRRIKLIQKKSATTGALKCEYNGISGESPAT
jgi:hypothetical protein